MLFPTVNRGELRERAEIADDALENLLKRGVVRPVSSAKGTGNRRTFGADDVMIAAVMSQLQRHAVGIAVLIKISNSLYEAAELGRTIITKPSDARAARAAVDQRLALIAEDADAEFHAYYGTRDVGSHTAEVPAARMPAQNLPFSEKLKDLNAAQIVSLDLYLDLVDPAYLDDDPPLVLWQVAPDEKVADRYRFNRVVGNWIPRIFPEKRLSWVAVPITELARRVWLGA